VLAASVIRNRPNIGAISNSETLVNFYQTTRSNIPENSHLAYTAPLAPESKKNTKISFQLALTLFCRTKNCINK
jgi:hypothetical protein